MRKSATEEGGGGAPFFHRVVEAPPRRAFRNRSAARPAAPIPPGMAGQGDLFLVLGGWEGGMVGRGARAKAAGSRMRLIFFGAALSRSAFLTRRPASTAATPRLATSVDTMTDLRRMKK